MSQHSIRRLPIVGIATLLVLALLSTVAFGSVVVRTPLPKSILSGTVQVTADVVNVSDFSYAILTIDGTGCGVSNALPVSFSVDSSQFSNGPHMLEVDLYNIGGAVAHSDPFKVYFLNTAGNTAYLPAPPPTQTGQTVTAPPLSNAPTTVASPHITPANLSVPSTTSTATTAKPTTGITPATKGIPVLLQGQPLNFTIPPYDDNGRTMVMLRTLVEYAGGAVEWKSPHVTVALDDLRLVFTVGQNTVLVNGRPTLMDRAAVLQQDRTFVPVYIWRSLMGGRVNYDVASHSVLLEERPYNATVASIR